MSLLRAMVITPKDSGVPRDSVVNVWHFEGNADATTCGAIRGALENFYEAVMPHLSAKLNPAGMTMKAYNLADAKPRPPIYEAAMTGTGSTGASISYPEACICLSFQAEKTAGQVQARRRGRVYLGPLGYTGIGNDEAIPATTVDAVQAAAVALLAVSDSSTWTWVVHSPTTGPTSWYAVQEGWVDNAVDIQRRRGLDPTYRNDF